MFEVKNRSEEAWGPLAKCGDREFNSMINVRRERAKDSIKNHLKRQKKLKKYMVVFKKHFCSDGFLIEAESDYDVSAAARQYFKQNENNIGFVAQARSPWASSYDGYDSISYVKVI